MCATTPAQTISDNGSPVTTVPEQSACATTTYTVPTVTDTVTVSQPAPIAPTAPTFASETPYAQTYPASFVERREVDVIDAISLRNAIATLQPGDLIKAVMPFSITSASSSVLTVSAHLSAPALIDLTGVSIAYTGTSNFAGVYLNNPSNVDLFGGDITTGQGGTCVLDHGGSRVVWYGFTAHDCGGSGVAALTAGGPVNNLDLEGDISHIGENLAWDPHADKGTGVHGAILWDANTTYGFTNNRFAFNVHDTTAGACVELGNDSIEAASGNTLIARCVNDSCKATTQTCGNGLQLWGDTAALGLDVKYLTVDSYAGYALYAGGVTTGQNLAGVTVEYGRATNDMLNPYPAGRALWDSSHGIVYMDIS